MENKTKFVITYKDGAESCRIFSEKEIEAGEVAKFAGPHSYKRYRGLGCCDRHSNPLFEGDQVRMLCRVKGLYEAGDIGTIIWDEYRHTFMIGVIGGRATERKLADTELIYSPGRMRIEARVKDTI